MAAPGVATGGSGRFAVSVRLSTPSMLIRTVSAVAGWSASVARPATRTAVWSVLWRGVSSVSTGLLVGGGGGIFTHISSTIT